MARRGSKSAGFWMIQQTKKKNDVEEIHGIVSFFANVGIPFAVSVNAFFYIFDL